MIRRSCPARIFPRSRRKYNAVFAPNGIATACSQLSESGLSATAPASGRHAYCACPPPAAPVEATTRSPVLTLATSFPTRSTSPDSSVPRTRAFHGFPIPNMSFAIGSMDLVTNVKLRTLQSPVDTVVACMAIRTSLSLGAGLSISLSWRRSDAPYCECRIAFTRPSFCDVRRRCAGGMRVVRGQLSDDVLGILVHTAEQRRADPVLVPQSNEAKAWRGGDDTVAVLGIAFGSEHRQLNPSEIRTEPGAPDNRAHVLEHASIVEPRVPVRHAYSAADACQRGNPEGAARETD